MKARKVLALLFVLLIFILLGVGYFYFIRLSNKSAVVPKTVNVKDVVAKMTLISQVEGYKLKLNNEDVLTKILTKEKTFEIGIFDPVSRTVVKPGRLMVVLTPISDLKLATTWPQGSEKTIIVSGDYTFDASTSTMTVYVYVAPGDMGLSNPEIKDSAFNYQLVTMFASANPEKNLSLDKDIFDEAQTLISKYFQNDMSKYPITVI